MDLRGVGPVVAARTLADVGDVARFADRNRFASWTGTAPLDASSGEQDRHRLSRAGNRRMNHMIHIAAISQIRLDTPGRAYYRRKRAEGKTPARGAALPHWMSMGTRVTVTCSSGTARDGLDVSPLDGLFQLVALVVAGRRDRRERAAPTRAEQ